MKLPKIKASSVTNLTDARYFAARGVEWMSFDFQQGSATQISPLTATAIKEWVEGVKYIAELGFVENTQGLEIIKKLGLDAVSLDMLVDWETLGAFSAETLVFREVVVSEDGSLSAVMDQMDHFSGHVFASVLNFSKNNWTWPAVKAQYDFWANLCKQHPVYLDIDLKPEELKDCIALLAPEGLLVKGGQEEKVGVKSFDDLDEWFDALDDLMS